MKTISSWVSEVMASIQLGKTIVNDNSMPYVIAEIGVNHEGSFEKAKELILLAKKGGAHAVKFQSYKAETLASKNSPSYWDLSKEPTTSQYNLFKKYDRFSPDNYLALADFCRESDIVFISTPFDNESIEFLDPIIPFYKIASADITNIPFLRKIASKGKPVILSTGAATFEEVDLAVISLRKGGCKDISLLHCILNYPTNPENANLNMIETLRIRYPQFVIGYSDHTLPDASMTVLTTAYLKGARILEKHFTYDKTLPGNDHYHAMDSDDLKIFFEQLEYIHSLEGSCSKSPLPSELISRKNARRSIVLTRKVEAGTLLTEDMLTYKRPGSGISPMHWNQVIGMRTALPLDSDQVLQWEDFTKSKSDSKERVIAVIQARMGSRRFPGKMIEKLAGRPLMEWILHRVSKAKLVDEIILATSISSENKVLEKIAWDMGIRTIRGDENDVLSRFETAAKDCSADIIIRICADNPFIDPYEIDNLVNFYFKNRPDYAFNHLNRLSNNYPDGFGAEIFTRGVLEDMNRLCLEQRHREHVTTYLWDNPYAYRMETFPAPEKMAFPDLRFDVDTPKDLEYLQLIAEKVGMDGTAVDFIEAEKNRMINKKINLRKTKQNIKIVATIEARMTSTRLPGKVLKRIVGKPVLELLIERLQSARNLNEIVVATTINDTDNPIIDLCNQLKVKYFRGSEDDVLQRVLDAAKSVSADLIVEITGDCPLIDPTIVDECIQAFLDGDYDYVSNSIEPSFPDGLDVKVFPVSVLEEVNNLTSDPVDHEHVSIYIYEHPERYCLKNITANKEMFWPELGITLDTQEDYELINIIFEELYPINPNFSGLDIVNFIRGRPELLEINMDIKRKDPHAEKV